jgi:cobalt/nickel transport system permease protein
VASWFASAYPDGLEWSIAKVTGQEALEAPEKGLHARLAAAQESTALLPDYGFKASEADAATQPATADGVGEEVWPAVSLGTSIAGLVGGLVTLVLAGLIGFAVKSRPSPRGT